MPRAAHLTLGCLLLGIAAIHAAQYVLSPLYADLAFLQDAWDYVNYLILVGLILMLVGHARTLRALGPGESGAVTRAGLKSTFAFYSTVAMSIFFAWNFVDNIREDSQSFAHLTVWAIFNPVFIVAAAMTGRALVRAGMRQKD